MSRLQGQAILRAVDERVRARYYRYDQHGIERGAPWTDGLLWTRSRGVGQLVAVAWGVDLSEGSGGSQEIPSAPLDAPVVWTIPSPRDWPDALSSVEAAEQLVANGDDPQADLVALACAAIWHLCGHGPNGSFTIVSRPSELWDLFDKDFEHRVPLSPYARDVEVWLLVDTTALVQSTEDRSVSINVSLGGVSSSLSYTGFPRGAIANHPEDLPVVDSVPLRVVTLRDVGTGRADGGGIKTLTITSAGPGPVLWGFAVHELHTSVLEQVS